MIITNRQYPVLEKIKSGKLKGVNIFESHFDEFNLKLPEIKELWAKIAPTLEKDVTIVTNPFYEAYAKSIPSLKGQLESFFEKGIMIGGTIIYKDVTACYFIYEVIDEVYSFCIFSFVDNTLMFVHTETKHFKTGKSHFFQFPYGQETKDKAAGIIWNVSSLLLFKKYAKVETEYLPANKKVKGFNCKYVNQTNANITILDSKWFTNLVKSDAFKVRGHFRLQPKKANGEWTKELIWINEFIKDGYTAPARKLKEFPETSNP